MGLSDADFLAISPRELDLLFQEDARIYRERVLMPTAMLQAAIFEVHRNAEARSEPFTAVDFLPPDPDEPAPDPEAPPTREEMEAYKARLFQGIKRS